MSKVVVGGYPPPGSFGVSTIDGRTGSFVSFGQWLMGARFAKGEPKWSHAFFVGYDGNIIEAQPKGCQIVPIEDYFEQLRSGDDVKFVTVKMTEQQTINAINAAYSFVGRRYGFSSYLYLALMKWKLAPKWLVNYVHKSKRLICSQLVDAAYDQAGVHLFEDGRTYHDVMPYNLADWSLTDIRARVFKLEVRDDEW